MLKFNYYFYWGVLLMLFSWIFFFGFLYLILMNSSYFLEWKILELNSLSIYYIIFFDWISTLFISVVLIISSMVVIYSMNYMGVGSYSSNRFLFLVILFVLSMLLMIISPNLLSILLGWDGLGLVSYCLVIYFNSMKSYLAGLITCLTNRLGDIGLLISISWMMSFGGWHFIFYVDLFNSLLFYMIIISSFTKSAQIPFSSWLPAAMAAPTPVSALVHSSTLVTAGVYLLIRFFNQEMFNNNYFLFLSLLTMFMSSFCANYEFDLKKIIALSTLSQLGLMMSCLFLGFVNLSFFHLLSHAMFKSLLFLCAGIFIFYMNNNQDIRFMGSVCNFLPFCTACFNLSNLTLCGIPFLSGFYSKDLILEMSLVYSMGLIMNFIFFISLGFTCSYTMRLFYYSMMINSKNKTHMFFYEEKLIMKFSIFLLTLFSVIFGCLILWTLMINVMLIFIPFHLKILPLILVFLGGWVGWSMCEYKGFLFNKFFYMSMNMWFMFSYSNYMYKYLYTFSDSYKNNLNWGDFYGAMGISFYFLKISNYFQFYSNNSIKIMFFSFFVWLIIIL
uniref:NADH-ubiquinone oxidoreductase chain 5 n=2 Tax=Empoascanara TaxID=562279 RepID=A0AA51RF41_9HEMI|nr:NADH dehydrogenase subunit 5 [Empoascanara falcata]YP_010952899.1 NADH dehydrogenase subunit 5 [Empoascanara quarta]WMQ52342.1 NADH dehydrogenase subunit 5 [Empoascanara quarta]WMQ53072.1 NADH dehydrogenase subunit 5 [Empoascanara falcata]